MTHAAGSRAAVEDDYRRGFHDGEAGLPRAHDGDSYAAGWHIGTTFANDDVAAAGPAKSTARTVDVDDVLAELPRGLWTPRST